MKNDDCCCPEFDPAPWQEQEIKWDDKLFMTDRVRSIFHIPINFGRVMQRMVKKIEAAEVKCDEMLVLADHDSLWGTNLFVSVGGEVTGGRMTRISGTFLSRVYEGPYRDMGKWMKDIKGYVQAKGKTMESLYTYYTTCPRCAKKYGKNHVVLLAKVD